MQTDLVESLRRHQPSFSQVIAFDPGKQQLLLMDFTVRNTTLTNTVLGDTDLFCNYIDLQLAEHGASLGIGGYAEHRTIYSRSRLFDGQHPDEEPRRFHLGMDIWGKAGLSVMAPLDARVHSCAFNDNRGDYGATVILSHRLDNFIFYTLYGHLNLAALKKLNEGAVIKKGETFAQLGPPSENGHWPPHLHFQLIKDLQNKKGDYPGVCKFSERDQYLANCPDPDLVLQLMQYAKNSADSY